MKKKERLLSIIKMAGFQNANQLIHDKSFQDICKKAGKAGKKKDFWTSKIRDKQQSVDKLMKEGFTDKQIIKILEFPLSFVICQRDKLNSPSNQL